MASFRGDFQQPCSWPDVDYWLVDPAQPSTPLISLHGELLIKTQFAGLGDRPAEPESSEVMRDWTGAMDSDIGRSERVGSETSHSDTNLCSEKWTINPSTSENAHFSLANDAESLKIRIFPAQISPKSPQNGQSPSTPPPIQPDLNASVSTAVRLKRKTGRKPEIIHCYFCSHLTGYRKDLINHLRKKHGISRSISLMYKRIKEGVYALQQHYRGEIRG